MIKKQSKYNWSLVFFLTMFPLIGVFGTAIYIYLHGIAWHEPILLLTLWFISGIGITMGYHRLFAHKSYQTNTFLEWTLMIFGSLALENTILKWASDHRKHHSLSDTEDDPYSIIKGFWHAHIGWIVKNTPEEKSRIVGVKDLEKKSAIIFQNKYYYHIAIVGGLLGPLLVGLIYGRPMGAVLWGGFLRITLVHHATFLINSLCHYKGRRTYDSNSSSRDSWFISLFTFGEGYHNYHHKFPSDFRNGINWFAFDPSKWIISILSFFRITSNLIRAKESLIFKSRFESLYAVLIKQINNSSNLYQNIYTTRIDILSKSANDLLLNWQKIDANTNKMSSHIEKKYLKKYRSEIKTILKDLTHISQELNNMSLCMH